MVRSEAEICACGKACVPEIYIGNSLIPICSVCHDLLAESDLEWDEDVTFKQMKAIIIMLKNINQHDKIHKALARGGRKYRKKKIFKKNSKA